MPLKCCEDEIHVTHVIQLLVVQGRYYLIVVFWALGLTEE